MRLSLQHFDSLISLVSHFNNDERCRDFITEQRWHGKVVCPFCGCTHVYECSNGDNQFKCSHCRKRFSCLVGTIFQNTKLPLQKWFMAMYLISSHKKGVSSHQLGRDIHVTQKTAWFLYTISEQSAFHHLCLNSFQHLKKKGHSLQSV